MKIHLIEGEVLTTAVEGTEAAQTFIANVVDEWVELDAPGLHNLMKHCALELTASVEDIQRGMDSGLDTLVVVHDKDKATIHLIKGQPATGVLHTPPETLQ